MNKLTNEQVEMVENNLALATHIAKRYMSKTDYIRNQDIIQEARIAMIKAVPKYNPEIAKFSTYMFPNIDGHLKRFVNYKDRIIPIPHQKHLKQKTQDKAEQAKIIFSLDKKISHSNGSYEDYTLMDILPDENNMENSIVNRLSVVEAIKKLDWKEKIVIIYRFYFDLNQTAIGRMMNISQVHAHRLERRAILKMKDFISD